MEREVGFTGLRRRKSTNGRARVYPCRLAGFPHGGLQALGLFQSLPLQYLKKTVPQRLKPLNITRLYGTGKPVPFRPLLFSAACSAPAMSDPAGERLSSSIYQVRKRSAGAEAQRFEDVFRHD